MVLSVRSGMDEVVIFLCYCSTTDANMHPLQPTSPGANLEVFSDWLGASGVDLQGDRAQYVFSKFDANNDSLLTVKEYVDKRLEPGDHLCHTTDDMDQAAVAFAGCACNPIAAPSLGACPAGNEIFLWIVGVLIKRGTLSHAQQFSVIRKTGLVSSK